MNLLPIFGDIFVYCMMWSVGGALTGPSRAAWNDYVWVVIGSQDPKWEEIWRTHSNPSWDRPKRRHAANTVEV